MRDPGGQSWFVALGGAVGLALMIAAVWASGASTATSLALTAVLILIAAAIVASARPRGTVPVEADSDQRDRMGDKVP